MRLTSDGMKVLDKLYNLRELEDFDRSILNNIYASSLINLIGKEDYEILNMLIQKYNIKL